MPGGLKRVRGGYSVSWGGRRTAKKTTKKRAKAQLRLLRAAEHGWRPRRRKRR